MADNVTLDAGSGGATIKTDDDGTAHWQYVKAAYGADNTQTRVTAANGLPIQNDSANALTVSLSATDNTVLDNIDSNTDFGAVVGGGLEATALRVTLASDSTGVLSVDDGGGALTVDNAGTFAVQVDGSALTSLQLIDDVVHTDDAAFTLGTSKGVMMMGFAGTQSVNANDAGAIAMETDGAIHIHDGGNTITVDGTVTANLSATDNAVLDQIDSNTDFGAVTGGGAEATALRVTLANDSTGVLSIDDNGGAITVDNGGTFAVQATLQASTNTTEVVGDVAHDAAAAGNPVAIAARATNSIEGLTQVAAADASYITSDLNGCVVTRPHTTLEEILSERVSNTDGASTAFTTFAAGGVGVHNYVTTISIYNSSATDGYVDIRDGTAGSVLFTAAAPAAGGSVINLPVPLKSSANTALAYDVSGALSTVYISMVGFQAQG